MSLWLLVFWIACFAGGYAIGMTIETLCERRRK